MLPAMLPRRFAATLGALRAVGVPATPSFLRSLSAAAGAAAPSGGAAAAAAAPPAPMPQPKNLRLDKSTLRLVERLRAVEEGASPRLAQVPARAGLWRRPKLAARGLPLRPQPPRPLTSPLPPLSLPLAARSKKELR